MPLEDTEGVKEGETVAQEDPRYVKQRASRLRYFGLALLCAAGCAYVRPLQRPERPEKPAAAAAVSEQDKTPAEPQIVGKVRPFELTDAALQTYKDSFDPATRAALEKEVGALKDPNFIWRLLVKYKFDIRNEEQVEYFIFILRAAGKGIEWAVDSLQEFYGMPFDTQLFADLRNILEIDRLRFFATTIALTSALAGAEGLDIDKPEIRQAFLRKAQALMAEVCTDELRKYFQNFEKHTGRKTTPTLSGLVYLADEGQTHFPKTDADWNRIKELDKQLAPLFGPLYEKNAPIFINLALKKPDLLQFAQKVRGAGLSFSEKEEITPGAIDILLHAPLEEKFFQYLAWRSRFNKTLELKQLKAEHDLFQDYHGQEISWDDKLTSQVVEEIKQRKFLGSPLVLAAYISSKADVDHLSNEFKLPFDNETLDELLDVFFEHVKEKAKIDVDPEIAKKEGKAQRTFDVFHKSIKYAIFVFLQGFEQEQKGQKEPDGKNPLQERIKAFGKAAESVKQLLKILPEKELHMLAAWGSQGFGFEAGSRLQWGELLGLFSNLAKEKEEVSDAMLAIHQAFQIEGAIILEELQAFYNMDAQTREAYRTWGFVLVPIFRSLGVKMDYESLQSLFTNQQFAAIVFQALYHPEKRENNEPLIAFIQDLERRFGIEKVNALELINLINIANGLRQNQTHLSKIHALFSAYADTTDKTGFLRGLGIYVAHSEKGIEEDIAQWTDPDRKRLYDRAAKHYRFRPDADDFFSLEEKDLRLLIRPEVKKWMALVAQAFEIELKKYSDAKRLAEYYQNPEFRTFLQSKEAKEFFDEMKKQGQKYSLWELDDMFEHFKNRDMLKYGSVLKEKYGIDVHKAEGGIIGGFFTVLGVGRDVNGLEYLRILKQYGFLSDLDDPSTHQRFQALREKLDVKANRNSLLYFFHINRHPDFYKRLISEPFLAFLKKFRETCPEFYVSFETAEELLQAFETGDVLGVLKTIHDVLDPGLNISEPDDLEVLLLIAKTPSLLAEITSDTFKKQWEGLKEKRKGQKPEFSDILVLLHLHESGMEPDVLYGEDFSEFAMRVLQRKNISLSHRAKLFSYYQDPLLKGKLVSELFRNTLGLLGQTGLSVTPNIIPLVLFFMDHPQLIAAFKQIEKDQIVAVHSLDDSRGYAMDALAVSNVLKSFALLQEDPQVKEFRKILEKNLPYRPHIGDGIALKSLTERFKDKKEFQTACKEAAKKLSKGEQHFPLNDLLFLFGPAPMEFDRATLEKDVGAGFAHDVHRTDSNFFSYRSYNDLSKLTIFELNKIKTLRNAFTNNAGLRQQVGAEIIRDIEKARTTELGGVVAMQNDGSVAFHYIPSESAFENGAYQLPTEVHDRGPGSLGMFHQHATQLDSRSFASPSGSIFRHGGDITVATVYQVDGVLITSLGKGKFAVHFYNEKRDVAFVGVFEY